MADIDLNELAAREDRAEDITSEFGGGGVLDDVLRSQAIRLVSGSFMIRSTVVLPRRQELPEEAFVEPARLFASARSCARSRHRVQAVPTGGVLAEVSPWPVALSNGWISRQHPDPDGWQKAAVVAVLRATLQRTGFQDIPLFWDYHSLDQVKFGGPDSGVIEARSDVEQARFKAALSKMAVLYAHHEVMILHLQMMPPGFAWVPIDQRGWVFFQDAIFSTTQKRSMSVRQGEGAEMRNAELFPVLYMQDYEALLQAADYEALLHLHIPRRAMTPEAFSTGLQNMQFTNVADSAVVSGLYNRMYPLL